MSLDIPRLTTRTVELSWTDTRGRRRRVLLEPVAQCPRVDRRVAVRRDGTFRPVGCARVRDVAVSVQD